MNYAPKKVFILKNKEYTEISYKEFCILRDNDSFGDRHFIPVQGMLLEVSKNVYKEFYSEIERKKYLRKLEHKFEILSIDSIHLFNTDVADIDVFDTVADKITVEKLRQCLALLSENERNLITDIYFNGISERELAKMQKVSQNAVHKRKHIILKKMKNFMES
ncbi:MAG: RNA polymerase sigma factor [Acutalibacteraceae bacterium]